MSTTEPSSTVIAADKLMDARDYSSAAVSIRQALRGRVHLPDSARIALVVRLSESLAFLGEYDEAISLANEVISTCPELENDATTARAHYALAVAHLFEGHLDEAQLDIERSLMLFKKTDNREAIAAALNWRGNIAFDRAEYQDAVSDFESSAGMARECGINRAVAVASDNLARTYLLLGRLTEARSAFGSNKLIYEQRGDSLNAIRHDLSLAYLEILERNFPRASAILKRIRPDEHSALPLRERGVWLEYSGELELAVGNLARSAELLAEAIAIGIQSGPDESLVGQSRRLLTEVRLAQGDLTGAEVESTRALQSIRQVGEKIEEAITVRIVAQIHMLRGRTDDAAESFIKSIQLLQSIGATYELAKACLASTSCEAIPIEARLSNLRSAEKIFNEMGVSYWIDMAAMVRARVDRMIDGPTTLSFTIG